MLEPIERNMSGDWMNCFKFEITLAKLISPSVRVRCETKKDLILPMRHQINLRPS